MQEKGVLKIKKPGSYTVVLVLLISLVIGAIAIRAEKTAFAQPITPDPISPQKGKYLVFIGGCNDCHTQGFAQSNAAVPESDWLTGDSIGWNGPWGTTYAINLRIFMNDLTEDNWVKSAKTLRVGPPMPWWALNAMQESDLRSMYRYIHGLGRKGKIAPHKLMPGKKPITPFILFVPQNP